MKMVILCAVLIPLASSLIPLLAAEGGEESGFGAWRLSVGGALNGGVKPSVRSSGAYRGLAVLPAVPAGRSSGQVPKWNSATGIDFGGGAFINPNSDYGLDGYTYNWRLPESAVRGGNFVMESAYVDAGTVTEYAGGHVGDGDQYQPGISVELSRTLWSDKERGWGVDLALAASYFFGNDIYDAHGTYARSQSYTEGKSVTTITGGDVLDPDYGADPVGGWYGGGQASFNGFGALGFGAGSITTVPVTTGGGTVNAASSFDASGDYRELEMFLMARPWYEITDWWRVFGEVGLAVSWSQFDFEYSAIGAGGRLGSSEDFSEWRCYGVAGAGTMFRLGSFDLSVDFLGRFLNDDLDCNGKYCSGSIEKSDWLMRVMVGWEF